MSQKIQRGRKVDLALLIRKYTISAFVLFTFIAYAIHDRLTTTDTTSVHLPPVNQSSGTQFVLSSSSVNQQSVLPRSTPLPPAATLAPPTAVALLPTAIPIIPSTATLVPPTAVPLLPTAIPIIPSSTPILPTATDIPPQVTALRNVNMRNGDSTFYDVINGLQSGETATIIGVSIRDSAWYLIQKADGSQGWVSAAVVTVNGNLVNVPYIQPPPLPTVAPPTRAPQGAYVNGQYTGSPADAFYGMVQVNVIIQGGQIADVQFLDYPHDRRTSQQINSIAMPYLTSEAIQVQSANVNIISGATLTSEAFAQSLQSALNKARSGV